ncbi:hypothetical protein ACP70R_015083 [Stipagrostis hirtigluma subsp. patula]
MVSSGAAASTHTTASSVSTHTVHVASDIVHTTVTASGDAVRRWVRITSWHLGRSGDPPVVGMGVQWTPPFAALPAGAEPRPCTLQLCSGNRCLVFQMAQAGGAPPALRRFLADAGVTFAGYNVASDCRKLRAHYDLEVASAMELRRASGMGNASLEEMAEAHLGLRGIVKSEKVGTSDWGVEILSKKQVRYACIDAYLSCRLGVRLHGAEHAKSSQASSEEDCPDSMSDVHCYPIVLSPTIGKCTVHRVLVATGCAQNLLSLTALDAMEVPRSKIEPVKHKLKGITGSSTVPVGRVSFPVTFGTAENFRTEKIVFDVVDFEMAYNAVLGFPALVKFMAVIHCADKMVELPGPKGAITLRVDQKVASKCHERSPRLISYTILVEEEEEEDLLAMH